MYREISDRTILFTGSERGFRRSRIVERRSQVVAALLAVAARGWPGTVTGMLTAFVIWNATKTWLCAPHSVVQGHAIWHLLGAGSAYLLYRYYDSEEAR